MTTTEPSSIQATVDAAVISFDKWRDRSPLPALATALVWIATVLFGLVPGTAISDGSPITKLVWVLVWSAILGRSSVARIKALVAARSVVSFDARVQQIAPRRLALELGVASSTSIEGIEANLVYMEITRQSWFSLSDQEPSSHAVTVYRGAQQPATGPEYTGRHELELPEDPSQYGWSRSSKTYERNWLVRVQVNLSDRPTYVRDIPISVRPTEPAPSGVTSSETHKSATSSSAGADSYRPAHDTLVHKLARAGWLQHVVKALVFGPVPVGIAYSMAGTSYGVEVDIATPIGVAHFVFLAAALILFGGMFGGPGLTANVRALNAIRKSESEQQDHRDRSGKALHNAAIVGYAVLGIPMLLGMSLGDIVGSEVVRWVSTVIGWIAFGAVVLFIRHVMKLAERQREAIRQAAHVPAVEAMPAPEMKPTQRHTEPPKPCE